MHSRAKLLIRLSIFDRCRRKNGSIMRQHISYSWTLKKAYDSIRREEFLSILIIKFGNPMKLVRLTKMRLNEP
jgi:hypothetical protein